MLLGLPICHGHGAGAAAPADAAPGRHPRVQSKAATTRSPRSPRSSTRSDPDVAALTGARGDRARPLRRGGDDCCARSPRAAPTSDAALELGLLQQMLGRPDADCDRSTAWRRWPARRAIRPAIARGGARAARARPLRRTPTLRTATPRPRAPNDPAINTAWGELFLEKYNKAEALKSFQTALEADASVDAGAPRRGARARRRQSAAGGRAREARARDQPVVRRRARLPRRSRRPTPSTATRRGSCSRRRSRSTRRASRRTRCSPRSPTSRTSSRSSTPRSPRRWPSRRTTATSTAWPASSPRTTTASTRRSTLTRRALALDPGNAARARRPRRPPAAHGRRAGRAHGARGVVQDRSVQRRRRSTCSSMLDTLDKFETVRDGDLIFRMHKDEAPVLQEYAMPLAHQALEHAGGALRVHAARADPHRDVPEARRLRRPERRPARHDRRARRLLRPRRDAWIRRRRGRRASSSGKRRCGTSWRTSSRCRCRTSACRAG